MSEIEKAREALAMQMYWTDLGEFSQAEAEADAIISVARAIAREEIEAAKGTYLTRDEQRSMGDALRLSGSKIATINQEGGDRNQLDRRQDREDKSPPAVEAPAAGSLQTFGGITIRADEPNIVTEGLGRPDLSIGGELSDMTALARRLAEALKTSDIYFRTPNLRAGIKDTNQIMDALAEARKHKLIE